MFDKGLLDVKMSVGDATQFDIKARASAAGSVPDFEIVRPHIDPEVIYGELRAMAEAVAAGKEVPLDFGDATR